ncbi:MAG: DUF4173 domain-containing protein [Flavobacteriales bacterium]
MTTLILRAGTVPIVWRNFLLLCSCVLFCDVLFWNTFPGLNIVLGAMSLAALLIARAAPMAMTSRAKAVLFAMLLSATMVIVHASIISILATIVFLVLFSAFLLEPALRSVLSAMGQVLYNFASVPMSFFEGIGAAVPEKGASRRGFRWIKLSLLPVLVLFVYYHIYRVANPKFEELTAGFMGRFADLLERFFNGVFTAHTLFLLAMAYLTGGLLFRLAPGFVAGAEAKLSDALVRIRIRRPHWKTPLSLNALERERRMGLVLLVAVNALLLMVNIIDINWVWFGFTVPEGFSLKQFVHEGTWLLILSILLSMGILLRLFRRNLNFHPRTLWLKRLALLWVAQNVVLGISVFLRNAHYIGFHGLAYKRIGVIVFLLLVLIGLATLAWKIHTKRSTFYLLRVNGWTAFAVLAMLTCFNWDRIIVEYNLDHPNPGEIDTDNYLALSDKVLPLLYAHQQDVSRQMVKHSANAVRWTETQDPEVFKEGLDRKSRAFLQRWEMAGWQSWTWAEQRTYNELLYMASGSDH